MLAAVASQFAQLVLACMSSGLEALLRDPTASAHAALGSSALTRIATETVLSILAALDWSVTPTNSTSIPSLVNSALYGTLLDLLQTLDVLNASNTDAIRADHAELSSLPPAPRFSAGPRPDHFFGCDPIGTRIIESSHPIVVC